MLYGKRIIHWYDLPSSCSEIPTSSVNLNVLDRWTERTDDFFIEFCSSKPILSRGNPEYKGTEEDQSCSSASRPCSDFADAISWLYIIRTASSENAASTSIAVASPLDIVWSVVLSSRETTIPAISAFVLLRSLWSIAKRRCDDDRREAYRWAGRVWCGAYTAATAAVTRQLARSPRRDNGEDVRKGAAVEHTGSANQ